MTLRINTLMPKGHSFISRKNGDFILSFYHFIISTVTVGLNFLLMAGCSLAR